MELYILGAGVFVFVAHLLDAFFQRFRVPDILILMLMGVVVGPFLGWLSPKDFGQVGPFMGALALVIILFEGGLSLKVSTLLSTAKRSIPFSLISFVLTVATLSGVVSLALGVGPWLSLLAGFIMGGTSSAVVIPIVRALKASEETTTMLTVESAITDVLCIVGTVGIATGLASKTGGVDTTELLMSAVSSLLLASGFGVAAALFWVFVLRRIQAMDKSMLMTLAYALVTYGVAEQAGISGAIAALTLGIVMGNIRAGMRFRIEMKKPMRKKDGETQTESSVVIATGELSGEERKVYAEVVFLLKAFFFFHLGLSVRPQDFLSLAGGAALLLAFIPIVPRYPAVRLIFPKRITQREASLATVLMPRGLAAAVLAQLPMQMGIEGGERLASIVGMMVFLSITLVALLVFLVERGLLAGPTRFLFASFYSESDAAQAEAEADEPTGESADRPDEADEANEGTDDKAPTTEPQQRCNGAPKA